MISNVGIYMTTSVADMITNVADMTTKVAVI